MLKLKPSRNWSLTHNNPTPETKAHYLDFPSLKHVIVGEEVGESGTPHLQIHLVYKNDKSMEKVIKEHPGAHVTVSRNVQAAIAYCRKEGAFEERGVPPKTKKEQGTSEKKRWKEIREAAEEGRYDDIPDDVRFTSFKTIQAHRNAALLKETYPDTTEKMKWYCGPPGTGKSRTAREAHPDAYLKMANKWWDGYQEQDVVILEDFDKKHDVLCHHLKIWADRYQFIGEFKTGARKLRPKLIIVTSNYHPRDIWQDEKDLDPILRRFDITKFGEWDEVEHKFNM